MKLTIMGNTPAQKNEKGAGVTKSGRPYIYTRSGVKDWQKSASQQLKEIVEAIEEAGASIEEYPVSVHTVFYRRDNREYDIDNAHSTVMDALVKARVLEGDGTKHVNVSSQSHAGVDKENPRVEVFIDQ